MTLAPGRYLRLFGAFARFGLLNEMAFRSNFIIKLFVQVVWMALMLVFYFTIFSHTENIAGWNRAQFLCFLGVYFALEGVIETFFLGNCTEFSELVRTGNLDLYLVKPIDEQFLITCRKVDWSTIPNLLIGISLIAYGMSQRTWTVEPHHVLLFCVFFICGVGLMYSFLLILTATSVWLVRNRGLMELWWLTTTLMRYPRGIFSGTVGSPLKWIFTYVVPILLIVNIPAETLVDKLKDQNEMFSGLGITLDSQGVILTVLGMTLFATVALLWISRWFFKYALQSYRSASS